MDLKRELVAIAWEIPFTVCGVFMMLSASALLIRFCLSEVAAGFQITVYRYGLLGSIGWWWRRQRGNWSLRPWKVVLDTFHTLIRLLLINIFVTLIAIIMARMILMLVSEHYGVLLRSVSSDVRPMAVMTTASLGVLYGFGGWVIGLLVIANRGTANKPRPISHPPTVDSRIGFQTRNPAAAHAYLFTLQKSSVVIAVMAGLASAFAQIAQHTDASGTLRHAPQRSLLFVIGCLTAIATGVLLRMSLGWLFTRTIALVLIDECLTRELEYANRSRQRQHRPRPAAEPHRTLARITTQLERTARRLDSTMSIGVSHPRATLLRSCINHLRDFQAEVDSLQPVLPQRIIGVLRDAVVVIVKPRHPKTYTALASAYNAFDDNGQPKDTFTTRAPTRIARNFERILTRVEQANRLATALAILGALAVVALLLILGRVGLETLPTLLR